jgi:hypothetical protein
MAGSDILERLRAEREIGRVMLRYARGIDRLDLEEVRRCFHPDARLHYGARFQGGLEEALEWLGRQLPKLRGTLHSFGPPWIELDLGEGVARCETYALNATRYPPAADGLLRQTLTGARYVDRLERRGAEWRIAERRQEIVWQHTAPEVPEPPTP